MASRAPHNDHLARQDTSLTAPHPNTDPDPDPDHQEDEVYRTATSSQLDGLDHIHAEALQLLGARKRRKRVRYSCTECHRRKHKCDRETPCAKCVERGVVSSCVPSDGGDPDLYDRLKQLEALLHRLVRIQRPVPPRPGTHHGQPASARPVANPNEAAMPATPGHGLSTSGATTFSSHSDAGQSGSSTPRRKSNPGVTTAASLPFRAQIGSELLEFSSTTQGYPPSAHFERLVREGSLDQDAIHNLALALPDQDETTALLDVFFRDINPLMFPFDEMWFRQAVNSAADVLWGDHEFTYAQDGPNHLSVIALLFAVLALTFLSLPPSLGSAAEGAARAARMSFQCHKAHLLASNLHSHDLFIVLSYLLLSRFLMLQRQARDSWLVLGSSIREAQYLGLHRLGPAPEPHVEKSLDDTIRRTIWMHLYFEDRFTSLIVGQAPLIHDAFCDTAPPTLLPSAPLPSIHFDLRRILHLRQDMSRISSKILDLFFSDEHDMTYDRVLCLDRELQVFRHSLPWPYRMDDPLAGPGLASFGAGREEASFRNVVLHRFLLQISISYLLVSLHLPFLRRGSADAEFDRSRRAAIEAATMDHQARQELRQHLEWPGHLARDSFVGGRFFYFHATSALGICLLSEPDLDQVARKVPLLDEFLEHANHHQRQQGVDPNRCIRQEISIVSLIRARVRRRFGPTGSAAFLETYQTPNTASLDCAEHTRLLAQRQMHAGSSAPDRASSSDTLYVANQIASSTASQIEGAQLMETRQPEVGEDLYDWWTWLVSSLTPSELAFDTTSASTSTQDSTFAE